MLQENYDQSIKKWKERLKVVTEVLNTNNFKKIQTFLNLNFMGLCGFCADTLEKSIKNDHIDDPQCCFCKLIKICNFHFDPTTLFWKIVQKSDNIQTNYKFFTPKEFKVELRELETMIKTMITEIEKYNPKNEPEPEEYDNDKEKVVIYKVICHKENKKYIIIDEAGDPSFRCDICNESHNHLENMIGKRTDYSPNHTVELVGRITFKDIRELAEKDRRGWE